MSILKFLRIEHAPGPIILALIVCLSALSVQAFGSTPASTKIYLGIAAPSPGLGLFGHAFAVVDRDPPSLLTASVYSYSAHIEPGEKFGLAKVMSGLAPFNIEKFEFDRFYHFDVRVKNQTIVIYELDLDVAQTAKLEGLLEADAKDPNFLDKYKYDIRANNCLTYIFSMINKVVPPSKRIHFRPVPGAFSPGSWSGLLTPGEVMMTFPFHLLTALKKEPIVRGTPIIYVSDKVDIKAAYLDLEKTLPVVAQSCGWSERIQKLVLENLKLAGKDGQHFSLDPLINLAIRSCPEGASALMPLLLITYRMAPIKDGLGRAAISSAMDRIDP